MKHFYICYPMETPNTPVSQKLLWLFDGWRNWVSEVPRVRDRVWIQTKHWFPSSTPSSLLLEHNFNWKITSRFWREPEEGGRDGTSGGLFWQHCGVLLKTRRFSAPAHLVYDPTLRWVLAKADKPHVLGPWDWMIHMGTAAVGASEYAKQGVPVTGVISCIDSRKSDALSPETDSPAACSWCLHFGP